MGALSGTHPRGKPVDLSTSYVGCVTMRDISWELYEQIRQATEGQNLRITFDSGRMVLMSPLRVHEYVKKVLARLLEATAMELNIPCLALGSTTWRRKALAKGLEADECYYIQHESEVRTLDEIDLDTNPPPDLAIEVITHQPLDRHSIYLALGVPELWHFDGEKVTFLHRTADGYVASEHSLAIPVLTSSIINEFLSRPSGMGQTALVREFISWLRTQSQD